MAVSGAEAEPAIDYRGIGAAIATISAVGISISLGLPLLSVVLAERGVSTTWIGLNTATAGLAAMAITPFVTPLAVRFGTVRLMIAVLLIGSVSFISFYVVEPFWAWFPLRVLFHGSLAAAFVLSEFWINALAPESRRGTILGIYATILSVGFMLGPVVLSITGFEGIAPFAVGACLFLLAMIPVIIATSSEPRLERSATAPFRTFLYAAPMATFAAFVFGAVEQGGMAILPLYGIALGFAETSAALLVSAIALGNLLFQVPFGLLADRVDRRWILLGIALTGALGAALLPAASSSLTMTMIVLVIWGGTVGGLYTVGLVHLGSRFRGADLAAANAAFVMMYAAGSTVGPATIGLGLDLWTPHGFAVAAGLFFVFYALISVLRIRKAWRATRSADQHP